MSARSFDFDPWPGANVSLAEAAEWIRRRIPPPPEDEPTTVPDGRRRLGPCAACGRGVYGTNPLAVCHEYGFMGHDRCAENYPFPGRTAY